MIPSNVPGADLAIVGLGQHLHCPDSSTSAGKIQTDQEAQQIEHASSVPHLITEHTPVSTTEHIQLYSRVLPCSLVAVQPPCNGECKPFF